jgi:4-hydroxy-3-polyprenylbenzoate decarboxylase
MKVVVGITGASGVIYGIRLLENLPEENDLILSENAGKLIEHETEYSIDDVKTLSTRFLSNTNLEADISSGSRSFDALVVIPCTMNTLSKIALGISDNLITRVASICMKEKRKMILVPRETPMSTIHLQNMARVSELGGIILPAAPGFYGSPKDIDDLINFIVGKVLDILGIENKIYKRWGGEDEGSDRKVVIL